MINIVPAIIAYVAASEYGVIITDEHSNILYANLAADDIFGSDPQGLLGRSLSDLIAEGQKHPHDTSMMAYVGQGGKRTNYAVHGVVGGVTLDGRPIKVNVTNRHSNKVGDVTYFVCHVELA